MDLFFKQSTESFFNQFQLASDDKYGPDEIVNENDENMYDVIEEKVADQVRRPQDIQFTSDSIPDISGVIESLQCPFCLDVAAQPVFIKHCLHFFCRNCIEQQIRLYKKECPLCKKSMGTKRELRSNVVLESILKRLRPAIDEYQDKMQESFQQIQKTQMEEQQEMTKLKNNQMINTQSNSESKKRKSMELDELLGEDSVLGDKNQTLDDVDFSGKSVEEIEGLRRIQRKVQRLQSAANKHELMLNKLIKVQYQQQNSMPTAEELKTLMLSPDDAKYYADYERIKRTIRSNEALLKKGLKIHDKPPMLDMRVKILFDEDLRTMIFPRVKEFQFRASSDSTLEIAAKALAQRNDHPQLWRKYSFSVIRKKRIDDETVEQQEVELKDLRRSFGMFKDSLDQEEIILFYRINAEFKNPFVSNEEKKFDKNVMDTEMVQN